MSEYHFHNARPADSDSKVCAVCNKPLGIWPGEDPVWIHAGGGMMAPGEDQALNTPIPPVPMTMRPPDLEDMVLRHRQAIRDLRERHAAEESELQERQLKEEDELQSAQDREMNDLWNTWEEDNS